MSFSFGRVGIKGRVEHCTLEGEQHKQQASYTNDVTTAICDSLHRRSLSDGWIPSIVGALSRRSTTDIEEIGIGALITANGLKVLAHQAGQIEVGAV